MTGVTLTGTGGGAAALGDSPQPALIASAATSAKRTGPRMGDCALFMCRDGSGGGHPTARSIAKPESSTASLERGEHRIRVRLGLGHARPVLLHPAVRTDPHRRADDAFGLLAVHDLVAVGAVRGHH